ncbi:capsule synthesis CapA-like protein (plasmid) [Rhizobium gallicum bv. gallicum R602sp]|uniref:Capsule synthesis CapA-like protein n=1 Tax=Rhizobium gallicum bv. gallicum R602sp TaxID=1041138 RepID=A0A0B4XAZ4_9HYPH|nr:CapA family protein [Rhizobium gallicum]AJD43910.1 capsule synthesis CapA-like protein [Rhizobium gallicum bv. gallicum R602sp]TDW16883.1 poly-gamma-glutamate synthesis protein (capsule biosynthesis protein) [Rhizobium azibense]
MEKHLHENGRVDDFDTVGSIETNVADGFTMAAVGDLLFARPVTKGRHPGFDEVVKILKDADVTFGNLETNILDVRSKGCPQAEYGGAYCISAPELGPDLKAMGFNMLSRANNHTVDWGVEGMRETSRALDENGLVHAGAGENLAQAGAARFLETISGRVALVSLATTFGPMARACDSVGEAPGRPGLNALRLQKSIVVPREQLEHLRQIRASLQGYGPPPHDKDRVVLGGMIYEGGEKAGYSYKPNSRDISGILRNVRRGKQFSDFCIVTNHGHEPGEWSLEPPDYEQSFARRVIDAGADAYIVHGPHILRGIEIYKGRPIFYSLGNFFCQDLRTPVGADMFDVYDKDPRVHTDAEVTIDEVAMGYPTAEGLVGSQSGPAFYESVVTISRYEVNQLAELRLYPIELGRSKRFANRGVPRLAVQAQARVILERLQKLSEPFGTKIEIEAGVGLVRLKPGSA